MYAAQNLSQQQQTQTNPHGKITQTVGTQTFRETYTSALAPKISSNEDFSSGETLKQNRGFSGQVEETLKLKNHEGQPIIVPKPVVGPNVPEWKNLVKNSYTETIKRPDEVHGVKVPDDNLQVSGTFSIRQFTTVTPTAGNFGVCLGSLIASGSRSSLSPDSEACSFGNSSSTTMTIGAIAGSSAATDAIFSAASGATGVSPLSLSAASAIQGYTAQLRLVSAKLTVFPIGNFNNNQGMFFGASLPRGIFAENLLSGLTNASIENLPNMTPQVISKGGMSVIYKPTDSKCFYYRDTNITNAAAADYDIGSLVIIGVGLSTATPYCPIYVQIDLNYEFLPLQGALLMGVSNGFVDREAFDEALNDCQNMLGAGQSSEVSPTEVPEGFTAVSNSSHIMFGEVSRSTGRMLVTTTRKSKNGGNKRTRTSENKTMFEQLADLAIGTAKKAAPALIDKLLM